MAKSVLMFVLVLALTIANFSVGFGVVLCLGEESHIDGDTGVHKCGDDHIALPEAIDEHANQVHCCESCSDISLDVFMNANLPGRSEKILAFDAKQNLLHPINIPIMHEFKNKHSFEHNDYLIDDFPEIYPISYNISSVLIC